MIVSFIIIFGTLPFPIVTKLDERFIAESASDFLIGKCLAKLQARAWLSRALCAPGQHTAKRRDSIVFFYLKRTKMQDSDRNFSGYVTVLRIPAV